MVSVKDGPETLSYNPCWPKALMTLGGNLGVERDQMRERSPVLTVWAYTDVHDNLIINGQSQEERVNIAIFSTSGIVSGAFEIYWKEQ